jgi:hydrogenase expression/formation protein HypC
MCLAVPSRITEINDTIGIVDVDGVTREASLMLLEDVQIGDYVIVHAGFAISKVDQESAEQTLADMREILALDDNALENTNRDTNSEQ